MAAPFVDSQGRKIHGGLGGSSQLDDQRASFVQSHPYTRLDTLLKEYVAVKLDLVVTGNSWDAIYDKINEGETGLQNTDNDVKQLFNNMVVKLGENADMIRPFVDLIPNEYGLSVVKAGIALVLMYSVKESEKRAKIYAAFAEVRDTIADARAYRKSFWTDTDVSRCAADLYDAVVHTVEDLLQFVPAEAPKDQRARDRWRQFGRLHKPKEKLPDIDTVLKDMKDKAKNLKRQAEGCSHERIGQILTTAKGAQASLTQVRQGVSKANVTAANIENEAIFVRKKVISIEAVAQETNEESKERSRIDAERHEELKRRLDEAIMGNSVDAKNGLVLVLNDKLSAVLDTIDRLEKRLLVQSDGSPPTTESPGRLLAKFGRTIADSTQTADVDALLLHPLQDPRSVITRKGQFDAGMQARAQSLLQNPRFGEWMQCTHSDLLLVDGNSTAQASGNVSALSLLCATLVANMTATYSDDLVMSFFCGFHSASLDPWFGPIGLVRSLIVQVLLFLDQQEKALGTTIRIKEPDAYIDSFRSTQPDAVVKVLHRLLQHIPQADLTVYCIIDCVSCFDKDLNGQFDEMKAVMDGLQYIVWEDSRMHVRFKALLTSPGRSTRRISSLVDSSQHITLISSHLGSQTISDLSVKAHIPQPSGVGSSEDDWD